MRPNPGYGVLRLVARPLEHIQVYAAAGTAWVNSIRRYFLSLAAFEADHLDFAVWLALNSCVSCHVVVHGIIIA